MGASSNLISVVVPAYNAQLWIAQTLSTIRSQTHQEIEIIVVDDGSTDRTAEVAAEALSGFSGRIEIIRQSNKGLPATRNVGFRASRGSWIHFMDADDLITPDMLSILFKKAVQNPSAAVVFGPYRRFSEDPSGRMIHIGDTICPDVDPAEPTTLLHAIVLIPAALVNREWFVKIGGFDRSLRYVAEDRDFNIRMATAGGRFVCAEAPEPVYLWRMIPGVRRLGGKNSRYRVAESMFVWLMSVKRCVGSRTLKECRLQASHENGIIIYTHFLLQIMYNDGLYDDFERCVNEFQKIIPGFIPRRPRLRWVLAKIIGYDIAAALHKFVSAPFHKRMKTGLECRYTKDTVGQIEDFDRP